MDRQDILEAISELKLYGMRASFDEIAGKGLVRVDTFRTQHAGEIGQPQSVGGRGAELAVDLIQRARRRLIASSPLPWPPRSAPKRARPAW